MKIIGITGGIASGKNTVCDFFIQAGGVVFDADLTVHEILDSDKETINQVAKKFPDSLVNGKINRKILGSIALKHSNQLEVLESIIHPRVQEKYQEFLENAKNLGKKFVILNIPLLLETQTYKCDVIIAVIADKEVRKERFLQREKDKNPQFFEKNKDFLTDRFENFINNQISDLTRIEKSDIVIENNSSLKELEEVTTQVIEEIL